jgi:type IV secretion system protein VirD4
MGRRTNRGPRGCRPSGLLSYAAHHTGRPLLAPDEVRKLPPGCELLFLAGQRPIVANKLRYFVDGEFKGLFDPV